MKRIILLPIALVSFMLFMSSCKSTQRVVYIPAANTEAVEEVAEETVEEAVEDIAEGRVVDEKFSLSSGDKSSFNKKFHVVVGSFSIKKNAENLQSTLRKEGNNSLLVQNSNGMYRVIIASYDDYGQAHEKTVHLSIRFADAWVLRQK